MFLGCSILTSFSGPRAFNNLRLITTHLNFVIFKFHQQSIQQHSSGSTQTEEVIANSMQQQFNATAIQCSSNSMQQQFNATAIQRLDIFSLKFQFSTSVNLTMILTYLNC